MAAPNLSWTLNTDRGSITFGRLLPFAGNTYDFTLAGGVYGKTYTAFVMSDDGLKCLAKSTFANGIYTIAFNTEDLREEFVRDMHEMRTFHCVVRDDEKCVAEGDLTIVWNPLWEDTSTGEVFTMRGPQGIPGENGRKGDTGRTGMSAYELAVLLGYTGTQEEWIESLRGQPGNTIMVRGKDAQGTETNNWYKVYAKQNYLGEWRMVLDQTPQEYDPDTNDYVLRTGPQSIDGVKTFTSSPIVPTIETADTSEDADPGDMVIDTDDDSTKSANTKWVTAKITAWWNAIKSSAISITGLWTFAGLVVKNNEDAAVLSVDPSNSQTSASKLSVTNNASVGGNLAITGNLTITGNTTFTGSIDHGDGIFDLFETKWLDYAKADTGKWRKYSASGFAKTAFPAAYAHLKSDYDNGTSGRDIANEVLNGTRIGRCVVRDAILSAPDNGSYLDCMANAFDPQSNTWEANAKFKVPAASSISSSATYTIFGNKDSSVDALTIAYQGSSGKLIWWASNIANGIVGSNTLTPNTWYWIKIVFDGEKYIVKISTDGTTWTQDSQVITSTAIPAKHWIVGNDYDTAPAIGFQIDLSETNIKMGEELVWEGVTRTYIDYRLAADGHKIVDSANASSVETAYTARGVAWYWVIDSTNEKFYLPRTKWGFVGIRNAVGQYVAPGLPDHNHHYNFQSSTTSTWNIQNSVLYNNPVNTATDNASVSNAIYGASDTVQPPASEMYLYFYLGR